MSYNIVHRSNNIIYLITNPNILLVCVQTLQTHYPKGR